jgi:hypothetical protein
MDIEKLVAQFAGNYAASTAFITGTSRTHVFIKHRLPLAIAA